MTEDNKDFQFSDVAHFLFYHYFCSFQSIHQRISNFIWGEPEEEEAQEDAEEVEADEKSGQEKDREGRLEKTGDYMEEEEEPGFLKKMERAIAGFFLDSPVARVSEEVGFSR